MTDLFQADRPWWSQADHESLLFICRKMQPLRVLEFGPGGSTLAMVEAGVPRIDSCEDDPIYLDRAHELLDVHPAVNLHLYTHSAIISVPALDEQRFDLGFVDGPRTTSLRPASLEYALNHCRRVFCHDAWTVMQFAGLWFQRHGTLAEVRR